MLTGGLSDPITGPEAHRAHPRLDRKERTPMRERTRVLVVDDEEMMRNLVAAMLSEDYEVTAVGGGLDALAEILARPPGLVLLDLNMPGMTGWQLIDRLKDLPSPPPVIAMSGMGTIEPTELRAVRRFVLGYLAKPFTHEQLTLTCARALEVAGAAEDAAFVDRRREPRRNLLVPAALMSPEGTPAALGQILNLSPGGALIDLGAALHPGMEMTLAFDIPGGQGPFRVTGRIQWQKDSKLGLSFIDVSDDDRQRLERLLALPTIPPAGG
jgi:CheY-like chemotaxis protein